MRFKFILKVNRQKSPLPILPVQYQYPISCWIYKMIKTGNPELKGWLQRNRFVAPRQVFPEFTFSNLLLNRQDYEKKKDRLMLLKDEIELIFSFKSPVEAGEYLEAVFMDQQFSIGDKKSRVFFSISRMEKLPLAEIKEKMHFKSISPILVCRKNEDPEKAAEIIEPGDEAYTEAFLQTLLSKKRKKSPDPDVENMLQNARMKILGEARQQVVLLKAGTNEEQEIKAFHLEFELEANKALIEYGYDTGFGEMNNKGFGCVEIIEEEEYDPLYRI